MDLKSPWNTKNLQMPRDPDLIRYRTGDLLFGGPRRSTELTSTWVSRCNWTSLESLCMERFQLWKSHLSRFLELICGRKSMKVLSWIFVRLYNNYTLIITFMFYIFCCLYISLSRTCSIMLICCTGVRSGIGCPWNRNRSERNNTSS